MSRDPEIEFYLGEMFGLPDRDVRSLTESFQKSTDALDGFFERTEMNLEPQEVSGLRDFVRTEKKRIPNMTVREMRVSVVQFLRKAADALAAI